MATALELMQLRDPAEAQTVDDRLSEIDHFPMKAARPPLRPSEVGTSAAPVPARA